MTAVVNSRLNPLANAFIPTNESKKAILHSIESENEGKATWEGGGKWNLDDLKSGYKMTLELNRQNVLWQDLIFSSITSVLDINLKTTSTPGETDLHMLGGSKLSVLPECLKDDQEQVQEPKTRTTPKTHAKEKDECNCPAMFGWIIPPDFIGNPFNFKYECSKKYPHSPTCRVKQEADVDYLDLKPKIKKWTLDRCLLEMKDILADVYDTISVDSDPIAKWDDKYKIKDYFEVFDSDSDEESDGLGADFTSGTEIEPDLVDDGVHPLLESESTVYEDEEDGVEYAERILGRSLSSSLPEYLDAETFGVGAVCNPPCSVWCESLPSAAKDTFRKYVQKSGNTDYKECPQRSAIEQRPIFKRSLSADDAPMHGQFSRDLNHSSKIESRDMLLLRRKYPLNDFEIQSSSSLTEGKRHASCDFTDQLLTSSTESNVWGKFDGVDSLWQPLPDCNAVNTFLRLNEKKGRGIKRQRTIS